MNNRDPKVMIPAKDAAIGQIMVIEVVILGDIGNGQVMATAEGVGQTGRWSMPNSVIGQALDEVPAWMAENYTHLADVVKGAQ